MVKENLLSLIDYMVKYQSIDSDLDFVMKNSRLHILITINPDGFVQTIVPDCESTNGHYNYNNFDLNRNFPDAFECQADPIQPETKAIAKWIYQSEFVFVSKFYRRLK